MAANKSKKKMMTMRTRRSLEGVMFISPWIIGAALFFIFPLVISIRLSFSNLVSVAGFQMEFIGIDNYK
ncbi:MAG: sugar ABC transporter permease, partial [Lachnospiraceae bacterium]